VQAAAAEAVAVTLLLASLGAAVLRPRGLSEAFVAVPAGVLVIVLGIVPAHDALDRLREIGPTVGFLAAILVFGHLCADAGVFDYLGARAAIASQGRAARLLLLVVVLAAAVTAVLTLDATVVLFTPVVLATVLALRIPHRAPLYACARLANSGSLLLPVSNLTNLLAFGATGLSFGRFAALMVAPWLIACTGEWVALRSFFAADAHADSGRTPAAAPSAPRYALTILAMTVALFVITSSVHVSPAWAALAGCVGLLVPRVATRQVRLRRLVGEASPGFCAFVLALAIVVQGVTRHGLGHALAHLLPDTSGLLQLIAVAALAAVLANLVNNLPATLALVPLLAGHPAALLAMLVGVNIGPNATYAGSLATLLWRRILPPEDRPRARDFHRLGVLATPVIVAATTVTLWAALRLVGT
jgi:arsenical pump membrane protein